MADAMVMTTLACGIPISIVGGQNTTGLSQGSDYLLPQLGVLLRNKEPARQMHDDLMIYQTRRHFVDECI